MQVGLARAQQMDSLADLLREIHTYYHPESNVPADVIRAYLHDELLAPGSHLKLVVAAEGDTVKGLAAIFLTYSLVELMPQQRRQCWLKELYVSSTHRSAGVGRALMIWVATYALDHGCARIDWPVRASNARGIAFYEKLGARTVTDRLSYRLELPDILSLAATPAA